MSDMQSDLDKYSKIWDAALQKGIFPDAPKRNNNIEDKDATTDFFGQNLSEPYDMDKPLNEVDTKYWARLSKKADPLYVESKLKDFKINTKALGNAQNPIHPDSVGKDQDVNVAQDWAMGGQKLEQLEKLKVELHDLEVKLNSILGNEDASAKTEETAQSKIDSLKKEIDKLSDSLTGGRFDHPPK